MASDSTGFPVIASLSSAGQLTVARQKAAAQLATTSPENGILSLPSPQIEEVTAKTTVLPETIRPGSEQYRVERIAAIGEPTNFSLTVDGEETEFTRWGTGDKVIVFFNHNGVEQSGSSGETESKIGQDLMRGSIAAELDAYAPLIEQGHSVVVWNYPHTTRLAREVGEMESKPDLAGIASSVVERIREKTGASELVMVGNSMGVGVLLWDLAALEADPKLEVVLIAPTAYFSPKANALSDSTNAVILANPDEDYFLSDAPELQDWLTVTAPRPAISSSRANATPSSAANSCVGSLLGGCWSK